MSERPIYAILSVSHLSARERAYAQRMGILREPAWRSSKLNVPDNSIKEGISKQNSLNLGDSDVMPAGNIRSSWRMNIESKTGNKRRMR